MTREEEINNAIIDLSIGDYNEDDPLDCDEYDGNDLKDAFIKGAKWADENPKCSWISVKDDLPCNHKELIEDSRRTKMVEVVFQDKGSGKRRVEVRQMLHHRIDHLYYDKWFWNAYWDEDIIYWRPIPEPPKE